MFFPSTKRRFIRTSVLILRTGRSSCMSAVTVKSPALSSLYPAGRWGSSAAYFCTPSVRVYLPLDTTLSPSIKRTFTDTSAGYLRTAAVSLAPAAAVKSPDWVRMYPWGTNSLSTAYFCTPAGTRKSPPRTVVSPSLNRMFMTTRPSLTGMGFTST